MMEERGKEGIVRGKRGKNIHEIEGLEKRAKRM